MRYRKGYRKPPVEHTVDVLDLTAPGLRLSGFPLVSNAGPRVYRRARSRQCDEYIGRSYRLAWLPAAVECQPSAR